MKDIAIYGAGGFGREVACLIERINKARETPIWNFIGFFDDGIPSTNDYPQGPVLGDINVLNTWKTSLSITVAGKVGIDGKPLEWAGDGNVETIR